MSIDINVVKRFWVMKIVLLFVVHQTTGKLVLTVNLAKIMFKKYSLL